MRRYYLQQGGHKKGPYVSGEIQALVSRGELAADADVVDQGGLKYRAGDIAPPKLESRELEQELSSASILGIAILWVRMLVAWFRTPSESKHYFGAVLLLPVLLCVFVCWLVSCDSRWLPLRDSDGSRGKLTVVIFTAGMAASMSLVLHGARRQLRRRFCAREVVSFEEWLARYYCDDGYTPEVARVVITLAAKRIGGGVQPVQVLPTDRLKEDFTLRLFGTAINRGVAPDDRRDYVVRKLGEWFKDRTGRELDPSPDWATIDEVIRGVSAQYRVP